MKIKGREKKVVEWLSEFDVWVTPSLTDIRETKKFKKVFNNVVEVFDLISPLVQSGEESQSLSVTEISNAFIALVCIRIDQNADKDSVEVGADVLEAFASALFLVAGKSDNNNKCQFPLYLKNQLNWTTLPSLKKKKNKYIIFQEPIPKVLKSESYMNRISSLLVKNNDLIADSVYADHCRLACILLSQFVEFVLSDEHSRQQFQILCQSYLSLKNSGKPASALLAPLVSFQVRGSVSASGGHEPEEKLRNQMIEWGLRKDIDFNKADVILDFETGGLQEASETEEAEDDENSKKIKDKKTRAFDFVLPFRVDDWVPRIFIQSQFYAGDSGSVSHKNVDQTDTSRLNATNLFRNKWSQSSEPIFIEYVDGAGYSSALAGDLKRILSKSDTKDFFQIKSAAVRLRRQLQEIGFLTPLEIIHSILLSKGDKAVAVKNLVEENYSIEEINRVFGVAFELGLIELTSSSEIRMTDEVKENSRRYLLLDIIANNGSEFSSPVNLNGVVLIPGFGPYFGVTLEVLGEIVDSENFDLWNAAHLARDLKWLSSAGLIILR